MMKTKMEKALGQEPSEKSLVWAGSAPAATVEEQLHDYEVMRGELDARMPAIMREAVDIMQGPLSPVEQWLSDARACQAVYQSGNVVSPAALQALVTRAVGLLG